MSATPQTPPTRALEIDTPKALAPQTPVPEAPTPQTPSVAHAPHAPEPPSVAHVRISPLAVFGLPPFWCIATCPMCDAAGFLQEDVHPLPLAPTSRCAYGHTYTLELESDLPLDADLDFLDEE